MGFNCGIVGLPNVGKSTIFNALTRSRAQAENYPFCTIDPNVGVVAVPDPRLDKLTKLVPTKKVVSTTMEFVDIAGLVKGASEGEGLGNQFLSHIAEVNAIAEVVRCFEDENIVHVHGSVNPKRDIEIVETELLLKDLEAVGKQIERLKKTAKSGDKKSSELLFVFEKLNKELTQGKPARKAALTEEEKEFIKSVPLLTQKPVIYVANLKDPHSVSKDPFYAQVEKIAKESGAVVTPICGKVEEEISRLETEVERSEYLEAMGLKEAGLNSLIRKGYELLKLITFFTVGPEENRAWTIPAGFRAPQAAGKIHSDLERGFIRAEVIGFDDFVSSGGEKGAREKGKLRLEGKEYVVKDGDILHIRFSV